MNRFMVTGLLLVLVPLVGCGNTLRGRVVEGPSSTAVIVNIDDDRMSDPGIAGISIELLDEDGVRLGRTISNEDGAFQVTIDDQYSGRFRVRCRTDEYANVSSTVFVPAGQKRLLVLLKPVKPIEPIDKDGG